MTSFGDAGLTYWVKQFYKGYIIEVSAPKIRTGGFNTRLTISKDSKSHVDKSLIHSSKVFCTPWMLLRLGWSLEGNRWIPDSSRLRWWYEETLHRSESCRTRTFSRSHASMRTAVGLRQTEWTDDRHSTSASNESVDAVVGSDNRTARSGRRTPRY